MFSKFILIELCTLFTNSLQLNNEKINKAVENYLPNVANPKSTFSYISIWKLFATAINVPYVNITLDVGAPI